jgi:hypothetical protein
MLSPDVLRLEEIRRYIQDVETEYYADYRDYVRDEKPTPKKIKLSEQSKVARAQLHVMIESVRRENPAALAEWAEYHTSFLKRIKAETSTEMNADTRRMMASASLQAWEKVLAGEQDFVSINPHFLKDYSEEVNKGPRWIPTSMPKEVSANKSWWQFWK